MILDKIVAHKKEEVKILKSRGFAGLEGPVTPPRGFRRALLADPGVAIIAEAKKASPSKGVIAPDFDPTSIAISYEKGGARAMSVLTDENFFQGHLDYLVQARAAVSLPVIRKDFIIAEVQVEQAAAYGADAILLIAAILELNQMADLYAQASDMGMDVLVEVRDEYELEKAISADSNLIGVNNRNLQDFSVDLETTFRIKNLIPDDIPLVSESGIRNGDDIQRLADNGVCAALIGETLMRADDRVAALKDLIL